MCVFGDPGQQQGMVMSATALILKVFVQSALFGRMFYLPLEEHSASSTLS